MVRSAAGVGRREASAAPRGRWVSRPNKGFRPATDEVVHLCLGGASIFHAPPIGFGDYPTTVEATPACGGSVVTPQSVPRSQLLKEIHDHADMVAHKLEVAQHHQDRLCLLADLRCSESRLDIERSLYPHLGGERRRESSA